MTKIDLYFGTPISEKASEQNETCALNHEISIEKANIELFNSVMRVLVKKNEEGSTYFDLSFISISGQDIVCPKVTYSTYNYNKSRYPKLTINGDYLTNMKSNTEIFISDDLVGKLGKFIEEDFSYEFIEFKRIGKVKMKKNQIVYLVGGKPYIHHNGNFLPIKT